MMLEIAIAKKQKVTADIISQLRKRVIAFDVETTGFNPRQDRIIEIGAVLFETGTPVEHFSTLVKVDAECSKIAAKVNQITVDMLQEAPPEAQAFQDFLDFLGNAARGETLMCAHNAPFDFSFLVNTLNRLNLSAELHYIDTLPFARQQVPGLDNYKQKTMEARFKVRNTQPHRAASDAESCGSILFKLLDLAEGKKICPKCGCSYAEPPALSRVDNNTEICPECGVMEALKAAAGLLKPDC